MYAICLHWGGLGAFGFEMSVAEDNTTSETPGTPKDIRRFSM